MKQFNAIFESDSLAGLQLEIDKASTKREISIPEQKDKSCPLFNIPDTFCQSAITECYQNLAKKKKPEMSYSRIDLHTVCQRIGEKVKAGIVDTKNKKLNERIIEYSQDNFIADTLCKMVTLYYMLVNYLYLDDRQKEILTIEKCLTQVWANRLTTRTSSGEYSTTGINTAPFFDHFLGLDGYKYEETKTPGERLIDFAADNKNRVIHLRCYTDISAGSGAHSIGCMSVDSNTIQLIDTTYLLVNYTRLRKEDLRSNRINGKEIKYAGLIF